MSRYPDHYNLQHRERDRDPRSQLFAGRTGGSEDPGQPSSSWAASSSFRAATPNSRGQYGDTTMSELESQNDMELEGLSAKVKMLKDITVAIGDEVTDSSRLLSTMNDGFDQTRTFLSGTMGRMTRMAQRSGIGWCVWLGFIALLFLFFVWVWLF